MTAADVVTLEVDCHAYPWHDADQWYAAGYSSRDDFPGLVGMAERYAVLIEYLPDHDLSNWAWWYRVTGPRDKVGVFLEEEYGPDASLFLDNEAS